MKLHLINGSNNCRKVEAVASHLGLELERVYLDLFEGDLKQPAFGTLNANTKVPVLEDGDYVLWESNAIIRYLCYTVPGNTLYPEDAKLRADVDRWLCWELAHFNHAFSALIWETVAKPGLLGGEADPVLVEVNTSYLTRYTAVLEESLEGREVLVGDGLTLVDYAVAHNEFFKEMVPFDWSPYPKVNAYFERMRAVEHWSKSAVPMEKLGRRP